jgi:ABC-type lipoprotein export system ATPase subunit
MTAIVELRDVFCVHRTSEGDAAALQGANLELERGEVLCLLGPSGAGKSTLLEIVAGLRRPSSGIVRVLGRDIGRLSARARARLRNRSLGMLEQSAGASLSPDVEGRAAVTLPLALRGAAHAARAARAHQLLEAARLSERADDLPAALSGGERQRLALCAALAHRPALLLADEPTGELDEAGADSVLQLIRTLSRSEGASVIIASHDPATARFADRTVTIRDGRIVEERLDGTGALVIGRGGSLALPRRLRERTGIAERAHAEATNGGLLLKPAPRRPLRTTHSDPEPLEVEPQTHDPARVELRSIVRRYGQGRAERVVLDGLTHAFASGALTAVQGRSGTGKTTLLRLVAALDRPDQGEVLVDDMGINRQSRERLAALRRHRIGYMAQEAAPVGFLSAHENVILALRLRDCSDDQARRRATDVLNQVGLAERARQRVFRLSAGEAQRVALARALATARGLLVVDEPTSHLDEDNARRIAVLLSQAAHRHRQTVICATHDPAIIEQSDVVISFQGSLASF